MQVFFEGRRKRHQSTAENEKIAKRAEEKAKVYGGECEIRKKSKEKARSCLAEKFLVLHREFCYTDLTFQIVPVFAGRYPIYKKIMKMERPGVVLIGCFCYTSI